MSLHFPFCFRSVHLRSTFTHYLPSHSCLQLHFRFPLSIVFHPRGPLSDIAFSVLHFALSYRILPFGLFRSAHCNPPLKLCFCILFFPVHFSIFISFFNFFFALYILAFRNCVFVFCHRIPCLRWHSSLHSVGHSDVLIFRYCCFYCIPLMCSIFAFC